MKRNASKQEGQALVFLKHFGKYSAPEVGAGPPSHQMELKQSPKGSTKQHHERQVALAAVSKEAWMDASEKRKFVSESQPGVEF